MERSLPASLLAACVFMAGPCRSVAEDGSRLVSICTPCHRLDGRSTGIPSVTRFEAEEIVDRMKAFRSNEHANKVMRAVSLSLSDEEIAAVADALARLGKSARTR